MIEFCVNFQFLKINNIFILTNDDYKLNIELSKILTIYMAYIIIIIDNDNNKSSFLTIKFF